MEHMSNIFSTSFEINFAKLTRVWLALILLTAIIDSLLFLSHPVDIMRVSYSRAWNFGIGMSVVVFNNKLSISHVLDGD